MLGDLHRDGDGQNLTLPDAKYLTKVYLRDCSSLKYSIELFIVEAFIQCTTFYEFLLILVERGNESKKMIRNHAFSF